MLHSRSTPLASQNADPFGPVFVCGSLLIKRHASIAWDKPVSAPDVYHAWQAVAEILRAECERPNCRCAAYVAVSGWGHAGP
eukprot:3170723-Pyramimonas_sp.AAC.1